MAKRKVNKARLIESAILASPEAKPKEIAASLKRYGVTPTYVSNIKSKLNAHPETQSDIGGSTSMRVARPAKTTDPLDAAIKFVKQCGGLKAAKAAIEKIERIKNL